MCPIRPPASPRIPPARGRLETYVKKCTCKKFHICLLYVSTICQRFLRLRSTPDWKNIGRPSCPPRPAPPLLQHHHHHQQQQQQHSPTRRSTIQINRRKISYTCTTFINRLAILSTRVHVKSARRVRRRDYCNIQRGMNGSFVWIGVVLWV